MFFLMTEYKKRKKKLGFALFGCQNFRESNNFIVFTENNMPEFFPAPVRWVQEYTEKTR